MTRGTAAVGNGFPLGVVVTTKAIAKSFANGMEYFNTFGGSPVAGEVGLAVLRALDSGRLQRNALVVGNYLMGRLRELQRRFECVGDVSAPSLYSTDLLRGCDAFEGLGHVVLQHDFPVIATNDC